MEYHVRKHNRLKEYDYAKEGAYFITICTNNRETILSEVCVDNSVGADSIRPILTEYGKITDAAINEISLHYTNIKIEKYVIMPDHIHLIVHIFPNDENNNGRQIANGRIISAPTVSRVIGQMKRWVSKQIGFSVWQKSYFDHIIRDERDYIIKCKYIEQNPIKWLLCNGQEPEEGDL